MLDSSESALSSDCEENFDQENGNDTESQGISLQLRPTLPKKQFEIPRFSPSAAWRLLSVDDADTKESAKFYHPEKFNLEPLCVRQVNEVVSDNNVLIILKKIQIK